MERHQLTIVYALLGLVIALLLVNIGLQATERHDNLTSWAFIKSNQLHSFFGDCKAGGGAIDVRPNAAPSIVFLCQYLDRTIEYTLSPGK